MSTGGGDAGRRPRVPAFLVTASELTWRIGLVTVGVVAIGWLFLYFSLLTLPAVVALLLASVLGPLVGFLRRHGWPGLLAAWTVLLSFLLALAGLIAVLVPVFMNETEDLGERYDEGIEDVEEWLETGPLEIEDPDVRGAIDGAVERLGDVDPGTVVVGVTLAGEIIAGALIAIVMAFFFLKDGAAIVDWFQRRIRFFRRADVVDAASAAWGSLSAYIRGTAIIGVVDGTLIGVGLWIIGVPLALPLGVITFFAAFFPLVGAVVAGALAALVALVTGGPVEALLVVALTVVVQQVEGDVLAPVVLGRFLRLHPLVVLVALTAGAIVAGIPGAFLAVPFTGVTVAAVTAARARQAQAAAGGAEPET